MQEAAVVLGVLRERGRKSLPLTQLYRQMFNKDLYLLAYGNIYSNEGAMTPGTGGETADGMSEEKIEEIAELMRQSATASPRPGELTYRKRMASSGHSAYRHGQINWLAKWCACFLRRTMNRDSQTVARVPQRTRVSHRAAGDTRDLERNDMVYRG